MATLRQKAAVKFYLENPRSVSAAMRKAGYSPNTAVDPGVLTKSKGWEELMEKYLKDKYLLNKHKLLLEKKETYREYNPETKKIAVVKTNEIDAQAVSKGLDLAYKLKKRYEESSGGGNQTNIIILPSEVLNKNGINNINRSPEADSLGSS